MGTPSANATVGGATGTTNVTAPLQPHFSRGVESESGGRGFDGWCVGHWPS